MSEGVRDCKKFGNHCSIPTNTMFTKFALEKQSLYKEFVVKINTFLTKLFEETRQCLCFKKKFKERYCE